MASPAWMAPFPASTFHRAPEAVVAATAIHDSAIGSVGCSAVISCRRAPAGIRHVELGSWEQGTREPGDGSRSPSEHSEPAHVVVTIAKAWHTWRIASVVPPGQGDM